MYGGLDVLAHVAGVIQVGPLENMTEADFREIMEVNAFAVLRLTRVALPLLRAARGAASSSSRRWAGRWRCPTSPPTPSASSR